MTAFPIITAEQGEKINAAFETKLFKNVQAYARRRGFVLRRAEVNGIVELRLFDPSLGKADRGDVYGDFASVREDLQGHPVVAAR